MTETFLNKRRDKNFEKIWNNKFLLLINFFFRIVINSPFYFIFCSFLAFFSALINYNVAMMIRKNVFLRDETEYSELVKEFEKDKDEVFFEKNDLIDKISFFFTERKKDSGNRIDQIKSSIEKSQLTIISKKDVLLIIKECFGSRSYDSIEKKTLDFFFNFGFYTYEKKNIFWKDFIVLFILFIVFVKGFISIIHWYTNSFVNDKIEKDLKLELFSILMNSSYENSSLISEKMITQFSSDLDSISNNIWNIPNRIIYVLTSVFLSFIYDLGSQSEGKEREFFHVLVVFVLFTSLFATIVFLLKKATILGIEAKKRYENDNRAIFERMRNLKYIKTNSSENFEQKKMSNLLEKTFQSNKLSLLWTTLFKAVPNYLITPNIPWIFLAIITFWKKEGYILTLSTVANYYFVITKLNNEVAKILDSFLVLEDLSSNLIIVTENVLKLTSSDNEKYYGNEIIKNGEIVLDNISFFYPSRPDNIILNNLSFVFENGKRYGIAGKNGIGKSTITNILLKLRRICSGKILISGKDISEVNDYNLHRNICHLTNHPTFFKISIAENVFYPFVYKEENDLERLIYAARKTKIISFINSLPLKFNTVLSEDGSDLSEGQKQQLEAMKVFLRDYKIYIFDEILSNVHPITRKDILKNIFDRVQNKTIITIDHQYDVFKYMDYVYGFSSKKFLKVKKESSKKLENNQ
jgi:ABC-type multidrug transport system fused ATPase/permease subunit